jgi:murein L,D-transpeptidase YafK
MPTRRAVLLLALLAPWSARALAAPEPARVAAARTKHGLELRRAFAQAGAVWPPRGVFLRITKATTPQDHKGFVELWAGSPHSALVQVRRVPVCASSGVLGPKRRAGDDQVPEGFYEVASLNPTSSYHLALRVSYPNASDRIRGRAGEPDADLGGDIMVHGNCVTIGCIPIEDDPIEEVYLAVRDAMAQGQQHVPVHVFPTPLNDEGLRALIASTDNTMLAAFWRELAVGYQAFERTHRVPDVSVDATGAYCVRTHVP